MNSKEIKIGAILSYFSLFLTMIITFIYTPYLLGKLGQAEFGIYSLVNTTIAYLTILDFGFGNAIIRYTAKFRVDEENNRIATMLGMFQVLYIIIGIIAFAISMILAVNVTAIFGKSLSASELHTARILLMLAAVNIGLSFPFSIYTSLINAYEKFIFIKLVAVVRSIINPIIMVIVLLMGYRSIGIIASVTVINLLFNLLYFVYSTKVLKIKTTFKGFDKALLIEMSTFSFFVFLNIIVDRIYWSTGQIIIGILINAASVSVYSISLQFINQVYTPISAAITNLFLPKLTIMDLKKTHPDTLTDLFIKVGRLQFIIVGLFLSGFLVFGKEFIVLWAGKEYTEAYASALIIMIPLTIPLIQNLGITILQAKNLHSFRSILYLGISLVNIMITIPLTMKYGQMGSAISIACSLTVGNVIIINIYYQVKIKINILKFWGNIGRFIIPLQFTIVIGWLIKKVITPTHLGDIFIGAIIFTIFYALFIWFMALNSFEKDLVIVPIRKIQKYWKNM